MKTSITLNKGSHALKHENTCVFLLFLPKQCKLINIQRVVPVQQPIMQKHMN